VATLLVSKRFYVSGFVQGVGFRFFVQRAARQVGVCGYVKNLYDGRVEIYAIGSEKQLGELRSELRRGPRGATVDELGEAEAEMLPQFADEFSIEHED
jgi:acylphosphatase